MTNAEAPEESVLVFMPFGRDAALTCDVLARAGVASRVCGDVESMCAECARGAGALLLTFEALDAESAEQLLQMLDAQEPWSDIPVLLFASRNESSDTLWATLGARANITVLERPVRMATLMSAVQSALRARRRQYETRGLLLHLAAADRQKDEFLATVSHELRTPLNSMLGWARLLRAGVLDEPTFRRAIDTIERNAQAQAGLIDDLLDVSRIISGKMRLSVEPLELRPIIEAAMDSVRPAAEAKGVGLESALDSDVGLVTGDSQRLQQIVWNLLANAVKFTPKGGEVRATLARRDSNVEIVVSDTGQGIAPDFLPYVFDRFRQADGTITRAHGGLGLGLAITRHLVELHGGAIRATSQGIGRGAIFEVSLPVRVAAGEPRSPRRLRPDAFAVSAFERIPVLKGLKVLVVDDERDALMLIEFVLGECAAEVHTATSVSAALEEIAVWEPDVLVSDVGMPGDDGYSLIRKVRALESAAARRMPAIAATAYAGAVDRERLLSAGYQAHLPKPIDPTELVDLVASVVRTPV